MLVYQTSEKWEDLACGVSKLDCCSTAALTGQIRALCTMSMKGHVKMLRYKAPEDPARFPFISSPTSTAERQIFFFDIEEARVGLKMPWAGSRQKKPCTL